MTFGYLISIISKMLSLLLNHKREKDENDLELKKLISMQFDNEVDMKAWVSQLFEKV